MLSLRVHVDAILCVRLSEAHRPRLLRRCVRHLLSYLLVTRATRPYCFRNVRGVVFAIQPMNISETMASAKFARERATEAFGQVYVLISRCALELAPRTQL